MIAKITLNIFLCLLFSFSAFSQEKNIAAGLKEAERLEALPNETAAFFKYNEVLKQQPGNIYACVKCSELCSRIGKRQKEKKARDDFYAAARSFADAALKMNPKSSDANCVMAMALGHLSMDRSNKEKIQAARDIKKYVDLALQYNPQNYKAWHILGRWHYEICSLNMFEKAAVKLFYGGVPQASVSEAIAAFEKAQSITKTGFILNDLELAKAYIKNDQPDKAKNTLLHMITLPNVTEDDMALKAEGRALLQKLK